jgi:hypothetical protein
VRRTALLVLAAGLLGAAAAAAEERPSPKFDGDWNVTLTCLNDEKSGARGYKYFFIAEVKDGLFLGKYGDEGRPGSLTLTGPILANGSALLEAKGLVGNSEHTTNRGARGTPFSYEVKAQFEDTKGTGERVKGRRCDVEFFKR